MARGDKRKSQKQGAQEPLSAEEREQVEALIGQTAELARALLEVSGKRDEIFARLAPVTTVSETVAQAYVAGLSRMRDERAHDAIEVAHAAGELDPRRQVAREARRTRITLRSRGVIPSLDVPLPSSVAPHPALPPEPAPLHEHVEPVHPRFARAYVSSTRDEGEVRLLTTWHEGADERWVRGYIFDLRFWESGVAHCAPLELMTLNRLSESLRDLLDLEESEQPVSVDWAEARRLVLEALDVNAWRKKELPAEYTRYQRQIQERLLDEPADEDIRAQIASERQRATREGDRHLIMRDLIPDEIVANWIGAWSFGDFGLAYDLLADSNPIREKQTREDYIALRRTWADETKPSAMRLAVIREQQQRASALWVPGGGATALGERKDLEAFWSLVMTDTEVTGQLDEAAMSTITSKETGRHWFWMGFSTARDANMGRWFITRIRDEGAASQGLNVDELQERLKAARQKADDITHQPPPQPGTDEAFEAIQTITAELTSALHYSDALAVRLPLDEKLYWDAITDARTLGNHERAAAILEHMQGRFNDDIRVRFERALEYFLVSDQQAQLGNAEQSHEWLNRAVALMREVVEADRTAEHLQGLGELLARQGHLSQGEEYLRAAIALDSQRASAYTDLADILMSRGTGEDLDAPGKRSQDEMRTLAQEALGILRQASTLAAPPPGVYTRMGAIYETLEQPEDALIAFQEAVRKDPGDVDAQYTLGMVLVDRERPDEAREHLENAVQLQPLNVAYRVGLARCYALLGRAGEATRELNFVDQLRPGLPAVAEIRALIAGSRGTP